MAVKAEKYVNVHSPGSENRVFPLFGMVPV